MKEKVQKTLSKKEFILQEKLFTKFLSFSSVFQKAEENKKPEELKVIEEEEEKESNSISKEKGIEFEGVEEELGILSEEMREMSLNSQERILPLTQQSFLNPVSIMQRIPEQLESNTRKHELEKQEDEGCGIDNHDLSAPINISKSIAYDFRFLAIWDQQGTTQSNKLFPAINKLQS